MGAHSEGPDGHDYTKWFHLATCFRSKIKKGPSTKGDIKGLDKLSPSQQSKVRKHVFGDGEDSSSSSDDDDDIPINALSKTKKRKFKDSDDSSSDDAAPPRKRRKRRALSDAQIDSMKVVELKRECKARDLKCSGKKHEIQDRLRDALRLEEEQRNAVLNESAESKAQRQREKAEHRALCESLRGYTNHTLKAMLKHNKMVQSGTKDVLVGRVADCKMYGVYPRCPECGGGILRVRYSPHQFGHNGQGQWKCPGFMEDDEFQRCSYTSWDELERAKWKELTEE